MSDILYHHFNDSATKDQILECLGQYIQEDVGSNIHSPDSKFDTDIFARLYRAFLLSMENRVPKALANCQQVLELQPESKAAIFAQAAIKINASKTFSTHAKRTLLESAFKDLLLLENQGFRGWGWGYNPQIFGG